MICPHCHQTIREEQRHLMAVDPDKPGLIESLRGAGGEAWRVFVTVALCLLMALVITGLTAIIRS